MPYLPVEEPGTSCVHLQQTKEIIKLFRTLIEHHSPEALIICENNVPNRENLTYFGNANEAHHLQLFFTAYTLLAGDCRHLKTWMMSMPPPSWHCLPELHCVTRWDRASPAGWFAQQ